MRGWMILDGLISAIGGVVLATGRPSPSLIALTVFCLVLFSLFAASALVRGRA